MPLPFLAGELAIATGEIAGAIEGLLGVCAGLYQGLRPRTEHAAADVVSFSGADAVEQAAPAWRYIERADGAATPFQSLALARTAAAVHVARGEQPHVVIVREAGRPVVILAVVSGGWGGLRTLRFLGDPLIQYGDAIATPAARLHHFESALSAVAAMPASLAVLRKVRADARIAPVLARHGTVVAEQEAPYVDVEGGVVRHARDERELRRFRRRLGERGDVNFALHRGNDAIGPLHEALRLKGQWLDERGLASQVIGDAGWEAVLEMLARDHPRMLAAASLTVGDTLAAIEVGLVHQQRWYAFLGATHPDFTRAGPGHVLMADTVAQCATEGLAVYDLLAPAQAYKRAMASGSVVIHDYAAALNLRGKLALWGARQLPAAKNAVNALPAPIRRAVLKLALKPTPNQGKK